MKSKLFAIGLLATTLSSCGYSSYQSEATGQVKRVVHQTPLVCFNRVDVDLSLGIMKNGVGSMSTQDIWLTLDDQKYLDILNQAAETGALVKVTYNVQRVVFCWEDHQITKVELVK